MRVGCMIVCELWIKVNKLCQQQIRWMSQMLFIKRTLTKLSIKPYSLIISQSHNTHIRSSWLFPPKITFRFSLFKRSWRDKQYAITEQIKKTLDSSSLMQIIKKKGHIMNLVHLTAILDRMQEQQMINTYDIVAFTIDKIRGFEQIFRLTHPEWVRTICNIICYLGNIKNTELNGLFRLVNFSLLIDKSKKIEKVMLITGLIRLGLFHETFAFQKDQKNGHKIYFEDVISDEFRLNQILSIWFAVVNQPSINSNTHLHLVFESLINSQAERQPSFSYREYTYATICYTSAFNHLKSQKKGRLFDIVHYKMPTAVAKDEYLLPHELCLLLTALSTIRRNELKNNKSSFAHKISSSGLQTILIDNFCHISSQKYVTLRHIANNFKILNEMFKLDEETVLFTLSKIKAILKEQRELMKIQSYELANKVDSLSLCSLTWKTNQYFYQRRHQIKDFKTITELDQIISELIVELHRLKIFQKFTVQELLMLYSGFFNLSKVQKVQLSSQFKEISIRTVMKTVRPLTLKQYTLFYSYFKKMQLISADFCMFIKSNVDRLCSLSETNNETALTISKENRCIMGLGETCLNCLQFKADDSNSEGVQARQ